MKAALLTRPPPRSNTAKPMLLVRPSHTQRPVTGRHEILYKAFKPCLIHHLPFPLFDYSAALGLPSVNLRYGHFDCRTSGKSDRNNSPASA
jgi:hypothetical protein